MGIAFLDQIRRVVVICNALRLMFESLVRNVIVSRGVLHLAINGSITVDLVILGVLQSIEVRVVPMVPFDLGHKS